MVDFLPYVITGVGQNNLSTVYIQYFWQGNHQIYGVYTIYHMLTHTHTDTRTDTHTHTQLAPDLHN